MQDEHAPSDDPIGPERFAELLAHLAHFSEANPEEVLGRLGANLAQFAEASQRVPAAIAALATQGDHGPATAFAAQLENSQARLRIEAPQLADLGPGPDAAPATSAKAPVASSPPGEAPPPFVPSPPPSVPSVADEPPRALPSYLKERAGPIAPAVVTRTFATDETLDPSSAQVARPALPFTPAAPGESRPSATVATPSEQAGQTVGLTDLAGASAPTPLEKAKQETWSVERYAAFLVDRRTQPAPWIRETYGVHSEREAIALLVHFNKRFAAEPGLREQWERLMNERVQATGKR